MHLAHADKVTMGYGFFSGWILGHFALKVTVWEATSTPMRFPSLSSKAWKFRDRFRRLCLEELPQEAILSNGKSLAPEGQTNEWLDTCFLLSGKSQIITLVTLKLHRRLNILNSRFPWTYRLFPVWSVFLKMRDARKYLLKRVYLSNRNIFEHPSFWDIPLLFMCLLHHLSITVIPNSIWGPQALRRKLGEMKINLCLDLSEKNKHCSRDITRFPACMNIPKSTEIPSILISSYGGMPPEQDAPPCGHFQP